MKQEWLDLCDYALQSKRAFYAGGRKIIRNMSYSFDLGGDNADDLVISDAGYTRAKLTMLRRLYLHEESRDAALDQWDIRLNKRKYASVSFHCFNHTRKGGENGSRISSVMGPCLQSVILTYMPDHTTIVDVNYRTTELYKKFPADLVFIRDELLAPFDFERAPVREMRCNFANATLHPMYYVTTIPHMPSAVFALEGMEHRDPTYHRHVVKWLQRYLCPEHITGIAKYAQAMRVHKDANERISAAAIKKLQTYLRQDKFNGGDDALEGDDDADE